VNGSLKVKSLPIAAGSVGLSRPADGPGLAGRNSRLEFGVGKPIVCPDIGFRVKP
jgi:hypothetical protein